jgi:hypothetical protein
LARAINLIGDPARHDFDCIRQIRSAFAYTRRTKIDFETLEVRTVCERINFPIFGDDTIKAPGVSRYRFFAACLIYSRMLMEMSTPGNHPSSRKTLARDWKYK